MAHYKLGLLLASDGDYKGAASLFKVAIARSSGRFPASHNDLGVMLAQMGHLTEAEREFQIALQQAEGKFAEADHNLKLCRTLLTVSAKNEIAALKLSERTEVLLHNRER